MSIGSWLKTHRRRLATHSLIIAGFLVFTGFFAGPLFNSLERIPGEAQLHRLDLPAETGGMISHIDELETDGHTTVEIQGWAFIEDQDSENSEVFIVLKSGRRTYVFDTMVRTRPDVTQHFEEMGLNLDYSGFSALLPLRRIAGGDYTIGILIRKGDVEALVYTHRTVDR